MRHRRAFLSRFPSRGDAESRSVSRSPRFTASGVALRELRRDAACQRVICGPRATARGDPSVPVRASSRTFARASERITSRRGSFRFVASRPTVKYNTSGRFRPGPRDRTASVATASTRPRARDRSRRRMSSPSAAIERADAEREPSDRVSEAA